MSCPEITWHLLLAFSSDWTLCKLYYNRYVFYVGTVKKQGASSHFFLNPEFSIPFLKAFNKIIIEDLRPSLSNIFKKHVHELSSHLNAHHCFCHGFLIFDFCHFYGVKS
ncbi:hypothetical protein PEPS_46940 (plasmid) [Persicobacter psychrovividus]|uniref:Uncharacterized protein n=1 Tax=Persicobacter psychrovividus TaxID=387638 RepID=A0ABM7VN26_9BACT|nr:hypothetical protein PEPS_46940 [Persicobacter psychrovividus]